MNDNREDYIEENEKKENQGWKYEILDMIKTFVFCFIIVMLLTRFVVRPVQVDGDSMYPNLLDEEIGLMNVFVAKFKDVERFDVVVIYNEERDENWVKRIIGLPGDTIYAKDDVVYVNGKPIEEPYLDNDYANKIRERGDNFTQDFDKIELGDDEYFLMGDNRVVSYDSRMVGPFTRDEIIGDGLCIIYPFSQIRMVGNAND